MLSAARWHNITGCTVAQHVVTMTSKVNGKTGTLTPCRSETPENFITKIGHNDYIAGGNTHAKFYGNRPMGVRLTNRVGIIVCYNHNYIANLHVSHNE